MKKKSITVIGGGTGTYTILTGIKKFDDLSVTAITNVTDSGGSTGRLRDEYGNLPVGDLRQALVALADDGNGNNLLRKLFLYRFDRGDMEGHNFGNLFITAMTDILGSEDRALRYTSRVLNIKGQVLPVCEKNIDLVAEYEDGSVLIGEADIDEPDGKHNKTQRIVRLKSQPQAHISKRAKEAIDHSDAVILGPGDLYSSLLSNFVLIGSKSSMKRNNAAFIYIVNLMTKYGQTHNFSAADHVKEVARYCGRKPDHILIHNKAIPPKILKLYESENAYPVVDDLDDEFADITIRANLASSTVIPKVKGDKINRSLVRHDSKKIAKLVHEIIS